MGLSRPLHSEFKKAKKQEMSVSSKEPLSIILLTEAIKIYQSTFLTESNEKVKRTM